MVSIAFLALVACDEGGFPPGGANNTTAGGTTGVSGTAGTTGVTATGTNTAGGIPGLTGTTGVNTTATTGIRTTASTGVNSTGATGTGDGGLPDGGEDGGMMMGGGSGDGDCCDDGDCLCHGPAPTGLTSDDGPFNTETYNLAGVGCVTYPTDAEPPFAAVAIADGYLGSGGCGRTQTDGWAEFYASHGIVTMIVETTGGDQPNVRGDKLLGGIAGFKSENGNSSSPLFGLLAGRYGTSGFSMGGGGTTYAASDDPGLYSSVALMPWGPVGGGVTVPTLITCGSSDGTAACSSHGTPAYGDMPDSTPKMRVEVSSGHVGQPSAGSGMQGAYGLAFQKVFLEGDERWRSVLVDAPNEQSNIQ